LPKDLLRKVGAIMKIGQIKYPYRLDKLIIEEYGVYNEFLKGAVCYCNPTVDFLSLSVGTKLLIPSRDEIAKLGRVRGRYDLVRD
jgi:hypothetical protein